MRTILLAAVMLGLCACGQSGFVGKWDGTISGGGAGGSGSYQDTWSISHVDGQPSKLDILTTQTCTEWQATEGNGIATWGTTCGQFSFAGTMQLQGAQLSVSFTITDANGGSASASGLLSRK